MLAFIAVILLFAEKYDALIFLIKATDLLNSECIFILTEKTIYFIMEYNDLKERMANLNDKKNQ